jgi:hypothetical protein
MRGSVPLWKHRPDKAQPRLKNVKQKLKGHIGHAIDHCTSATQECRAELVNHLIAVQHRNRKKN